MTSQLFESQRAIGEELLAACWQASSIAVSSKPGSAWVLSDPSRQIRVRMCADLAGVAAEVTAACKPGSRRMLYPWRLTINDAPEAAIVAALLAAPGADAGTGRNRRRIMNALQVAGLRCDRGRLMRALSGTAHWSSADRAASATLTMPSSRTDFGSLRILTPATDLESLPGAPAAVLIPLINASRRREGTQQ